MENLTLNITDDIQYISERRDAALERFNDKIKMNNSTPEEFHKALDAVLRINKQLKTLEDCLVVFRVTSKQE